MPASPPPQPTLPASLLLVRHGESVGNVADRRAHEAGHGRIDLPSRDADVELSDVGREQAQALGHRLAALEPQERPTLVLSSPYRRAADTALTAMDASGLGVPVRFDERLRERELGVLDALTGAGVREHFPEEAERRDAIGKFYYRPPAGESWCDVALRVRSFVASLQQEHAGERVMVTTHQAVIMLFRYVLEGLSEREILEIDAAERILNCSITTYGGALPHLQLLGFNDADHVAREAPVTAEPPEEDVKGAEPAADEAVDA